MNHGSTSPPLRFLVLMLFVTLCQQIVSETTDSTTAESIISTYSTISDTPERKYTDLDILGFATPWNSKGEEIAITQSSRSRLDIVSPVTYQYKLAGLHGGHDYSPSFYKKIKEASPSTLLMPRVVFERFQASQDEKPSELYNTENVVEEIMKEWEKNKFDGIVLEIWQTVMPLTKKSYKILRLLGSKLRERGLSTALVVPPFAKDMEKIGVAKDEIHQLKDSYNYFVVMTYDFSTPASQIGPISPAEWIKIVINYFTSDCGLGEKVLMGLNFYGVDFVAERDSAEKNSHIIGSQVIKILEQHNPKLIWHDPSKEHYFDYTSEGGVKRRVFYPTARTIGERVKLAKELGCGGVAIWDIGQGLDHFFDQF